MGDLFGKFFPLLFQCYWLLSGSCWPLWHSGYTLLASRSPATPATWRVWMWNAHSSHPASPSQFKPRSSFLWLSLISWDYSWPIKWHWILWWTFLTEVLVTNCVPPVFVLEYLHYVTKSLEALYPNSQPYMWWRSFNPAKGTLQSQGWTWRIVDCLVPGAWYLLRLGIWWVLVI